MGGVVTIDEVGDIVDDLTRLSGLLDLDSEPTQLSQLLINWLLLGFATKLLVQNWRFHL